MTGAFLHFPSRAEITVEPAPAHPFALPISPVSGLFRFSPLPASIHRVHIHGTVTLAWPGRLLCIQDGPQGLCAQTDQTTSLHPGEPADVVGFPIIGAFTPTMTRATYVSAGFQQSVPAVAITADQALQGNPRRRICGTAGPTCRPGSKRKPPEYRFVRSESRLFGHLARTVRRAATHLAKGNHTQVVGICSLKGGIDRDGIPWNARAIPDSFQILLRSPQDVVATRSLRVDPAHAITILGLVAALTLVVLAWVFVLRHQVHEQTHVIVQQLQEAGKLGLQIRTLNEDLEERIDAYQGTGGNQL